jgi:hypothetical protein
MIGGETPNQRIVLVLKLASLSLVLIYLSGTNLYAQNSRKMIIRPLTLAEPVEITIELNGQPVNAARAVFPDQGVEFVLRSLTVMPTGSESSRSR